jgi:hypothetical protein
MQIKIKPIKEKKKEHKKEKKHANNNMRGE